MCQPPRWLRPGVLSAAVRERLIGFAQATVEHGFPRRRAPGVVASPATDDLERKLAELDREIDNLLFETRVRREVVSDTAARLLREVRRRKAQSLGTPITPYQDPHPVDDSGGVTP